MVQLCIYFASGQYIAMLHTSIGIGIGYWTIGIARGQYCLLGALLGTVLTLLYMQIGPTSIVIDLI